MLSKRAFSLACLTFALLSTAAFAATGTVTFDFPTLDNPGCTDITNGEGVIRSGSTVAGIKAQIKAAYDNGWANADGEITSSWAADRYNNGNGETGIGYNSNDNVGATTDWNGAAFLNGDLTGSIDEILIKYTWNGDCDLDGILTTSDISSITMGPGGNWQDGDFDNNGTVNSNDISMLSDAWYTTHHGGAPLGAAPTPEPATWLLIVMAVGGLGLFKFFKK